MAPRVPPSFNEQGFRVKGDGGIKDSSQAKVMSREDLRGGILSFRKNVRQSNTNSECLGCKDFISTKAARHHFQP